MMEEQNNLKAIDLHNKVTGEELERLLKMQLAALAEDPRLAHELPPLMVWGAPGLGKSSILKDVAKELGIGFIDVRLAQREPVDIRGLPVPGKDGVKWLVASEWPRDAKSRGIILFDEITAADRSLQVAAYEFILDRRLGELYSVPDGWYICAAGNRTEDRAVAATMSSALANRFLHVEMQEDVESWIVWARTHDIHPSVMGFVRYRPGCLFNQEGENLERGWPTPRSWERVSRMLERFKGEDEGLLRKVVYGLVGNRAGVEFMEFHKINETFDDVLELMTNPEKKINIPAAVDRKYALCSAMTYLLWRGKDESEESVRIDGFYRICMELPSDFASMAMMDAMAGNRRDSSSVFSEKLFRHPSYKAWADKHVYPGDGEGEGGFKDQWGEKSIDPDFKVGFPKDLPEKIREKIVAVAQQIQWTRGDIPAHLESVVRAALKPQIRWQEVLAQFVTSCYGGSRRWLPPNRRHIGRGLYLQSSRKEMLRAVVAVDTSGSTTNDLPQFFSELNSLLNSFGDYELTVIQCDSEIADVSRYDAFNPIRSPEWKTYGHGGTDFRPPFEYVEEHPDLEPSCLIYITDGCGPAPERAPRFPVLWLLTADGSNPAPWGWKLWFKPMGKNERLPIHRQ